MFPQLKHFKASEFDNPDKMSPEFLYRLDKLREECGFPFVINSDYRAPSHPIEAAKSSPGEHTEGHAVDIQVRSGVQRRKLVKCALELGFNGIGVADTFVHIDDRDSVPVMWTY